MKKFSLVFICLLIIISCSSDDSNSEITVATINISQVTDILINSAKSGGNVVSDGGSEITSKGVCWSKTFNPDINDDLTNEGVGLGNFNSNISSLEPNTTYHIRAYAKNNAGTAYSEELSFTTENNCSDNIYEGYIILYTQTEVNNFGLNGYCEISEGLIISYQGNTDDPIIDLTPLSTIQKVFRLEVYSTSVLVDLHGLENLQEVTTNVSIYDNLRLENIDALSNIPEVGGLILIEYNRKLKNIDGLIGVTSINQVENINYQHISIEDNEKLENIDGLSNLINFENGTIYIQFNNILTNIDGLSNISSTLRSISIDNNLLLNNINGLTDLESIDYLYITGNPLITNIDVLSNLINVEIDLEINSNEELIDFCGLEPIINNNGIGGQYIVENNAYNPTIQDILDGNCSQ